jgi:DNA-binding NtrC family response regulator
LKSVAELAVTLSGKDEIKPSDLVLDQDESISLTGDNELTLKEHEIRIIKTTLKRYNNDIKMAAEKLDIGISTIYRLLNREKEL